MFERHLQARGVSTQGQHTLISRPRIRRALTHVLSLSNGPTPRNSAPDLRHRVQPLPCGRHATALWRLSSIPVLSRPYDCRPACATSFTFAMALDFARTSVLPSPHNAPTQPNRHEEHPVWPTCPLCISAPHPPSSVTVIAQSGTPNGPECHLSQLRNWHNRTVCGTFSDFLAPERPSRMTVEGMR